MDVKITSLDHAPPYAKRPSRTLRREALAPYLFILPFAVLFLLFFIVPILYAIPGIIAALLWGYLYDPSLSPIVKGFSSLGPHCYPQL